MTDRGWKLTLCGLAVPLLALGAWAAVDVESFASSVADFGPFNAHLVHDFAAASATFGLGLVAAAFVPSWRLPVLVLAATWNALHGISHLADITAAEPRIVGPIEAAVLIAATVVLVLLARRVKPENP
jgi:predicted anti-sigma-YlaC factor YlaD